MTVGIGAPTELWQGARMLQVVLWGLLAAGTPQLVVLDVDNRADAPVSVIDSLDVVLADRAGSVATVDVIAAADLQALAGISAAKQAVDCDDDSCLAELAGAMDARYVLKPSLTRLGQRYALRIVIFDAVEGRIAARGTAAADTLKDLAVAAELEVDRTLAAAGLAAVSAPTSSSKLPALTTIGVGGAVAALGIGVLGWSEVSLSSPAALTSTTYNDARTRGLIGAGIGALGVVAVAVGGVLFVVME